MAGPVALDGAGCLVTGASAGIGRMLAERLTVDGANVCLHGRDKAALGDVAETTGGAPWIDADLADPDAPARVAAAARRAVGDVDILINNAGVGWAGPFTEMSPSDARALMTVDLVAPVLLTRELVGDMVTRGRGHIVFIGSIAGHVGVPDEAVYAAAKAGLVGLADSLRAELRGDGVAVSLVSPGPVATGFFARRGRPYERRFPRPVEPDRVVDAAVRCLRSGQAEMFVPRWLTVPARLRGAMPGTYRRLATPFTRRSVRS